MFLSEKQKTYLAMKVQGALQQEERAQLQISAEQVIQEVKNVINKNLAEEERLDQLVDEELKRLEESQGDEFQRYKMYPLLKRKFADESGFIL